MSFGINLKRERELRGITLEEISNATKVSVRLLKAIEADRFDILPEGLFRKSFIKSYAKYLGMKEESVLQEYNLSFQVNSSMVPNEEKTLRSGMSSEFSWQRAVLIFAIVLIILTGGAIFWYFNAARVRSSSPSSASSSDHSETAIINQGVRTNTLRHIDAVAQTNSSLPAAKKTIGSSIPPPISSQEQPAPSLPGSASVEPLNSPAGQGTATANNGPLGTALAPGGNSVVLPPTNLAPIANPRLKVLGEIASQQSPQPTSVQTQNPTIEESGNILELMIEATAQTWLSVSGNEKTLYSGIMQPQENRKFSLEKPLKLVVGNAGGVKVSVNGQSFTVLGRSSEKRVMEISAENYRQFLAPGQ